MAARHQQQQIREIEVGIDQARAERMAFEMVDRDQRLARRQRQPLAGEQRDHHPADQARPAVAAIASTSPIDILASASTWRMRPGRISTWARAAISGTTPPKGWCACVLADHRLREDSPVAGHQRRRAVVAAAFEAEDQCHRRHLRCGGPLPEWPRADALGGRRCKDSASERAVRRWRWRRRARSRRRSRPRTAGPTAASRSSPINTTGDKVQDRPLAEIGGKALWTKELDRALIDGEVDFCVHSMKDVESVRPDGIHIAAVRPRGDVARPLIGAESIEALKQGAVVGTSSPRRAAQLLPIRPDLKIVPMRGNVETRLAKLEAGEVDATLLAAAGPQAARHANVGTADPDRDHAARAGPGGDRASNAAPTTP